MSETVELESPLFYHHTEENGLILAMCRLEVRCKLLLLVMRTPAPCILDMIKRKVLKVKLSLNVIHFFWQREKLSMPSFMWEKYP